MLKIQKYINIKKRRRLNKKMNKLFLESISEYYLNLVQLEMSAPALRAIMKAKPAFKSRWVKVFKHYKLQGKSPVEAKELANRMLGVY